MSYPTGMSYQTGDHYNRVAAQMDSYLNSYPQYHHSHSGYAMAAPIAGEIARHGAQRMGMDPFVAHQFGGFIQSFARNLLS